MVDKSNKAEFEFPPIDKTRASKIRLGKAQNVVGCCTIAGPCMVAISNAKQRTGKKRKRVVDKRHRCL